MMDLVLREDPNTAASQRGAVAEIGIQVRWLLSLAPRFEDCVHGFSAQSVLHLFELFAMTENMTSLSPDLISDVALLGSSTVISAERPQEFGDLLTEALLLLFYVHLPWDALYTIHCLNELVTNFLR